MSDRQLGGLTVRDLGKRIVVFAADDSGPIAVGILDSVEHHNSDDGARTTLLLTDTGANANYLGLRILVDGEWTPDASCWVGYPADMRCSTTT